jgi:hypothetical protein
MNLCRLLLVSLSLAALLMLLACGGGGGSNGPGTGNTITSNASTITIAGANSNVQPISVIGFNTPVTSIQVCNTAGANCVTVNNVLVDTGSAGLRVISTAVATVGLTQLTAPTSGRLAECVMFGVGALGSGTATFGLVQMGQVKINGETTATHAPGGIPIQVIGDNTDLLPRN